MIGHDTYPRLFSLSNARRKSEKDYGPHAYSNKFSCLALMLTAGAGPGARRAIRDGNGVT
jgi:hypothetical protein